MKYNSESMYPKDKINDVIITKEGTKADVLAFAHGRSPSHLKAAKLGRKVTNRIDFYFIDRAVGPIS